LYKELEFGCGLLGYPSEVYGAGAEKIIMIYDRYG